ncbi:hypothetical protein GWK16_12300 [Roseomonas sp. JC162]|uniref:Lysine-specific metallo-endopeptidase domain-containing protein n=1 Tax=Neoroseomonas marina TaxID=1232220 RepID=A0A848EEX3_9PROT|nr:hypothetical protein [Neoroseomonas marina]NMJ42027.1 hypothetical protein [Neoroseomonas marina]
MPANRYITKNGQISIVGIADAGMSCNHPADNPADPRWQKWPTQVTVPTSFRGSGRPINVVTCFEEAMALVHRSVGDARNPQCDSYFLELGRGRAQSVRRTLTALLGYKLIFFRNGSANPADDFRVTDGSAGVTMGEVLSSNNVAGNAIISISAYAARSPVSLAATIVHELAHVAGAPGRPADGDWRAMNEAARAPYFGAENALKVCGFTRQHNPEIYGEILDRFQRRMKITGLA